MVKKAKFERDFVEVENRFPKLRYFQDVKLQTWKITGELDICDIEGMYWNTFSIIILVPQSYPYCVPIVIEKSTIIPRDEDWHISEQGVCCIDVTHKLTVESRTGINICKFISDKVYPFFANQLHKIHKKSYAGEEYAHHFEGILQYYYEEHDMPDEQSILYLLSHIVNNRKTDRNDNCPCGSYKKAKHCHLDSIAYIRRLGIEKIKDDIEKIKSRLALP